MAETPTGFTPGPANPQPMNFGGGFTSPALDPTDWMPAESMELLRRLSDRASDAHSLTIPFSEIQEASNTRILAEQRLKTLQGHPAEGGHNLNDAHNSVLQAKKNLQRATEAFHRLNERNAVNSAAWQAKAGAFKACDDWAKDGRPAGTVMEFYPIEPPRPAKGDTVIDLIEKLRRRVRELKADANRISSAQFPAAHVKSKMREAITRLAEAGMPSIDAMIEHDAPLTFPTVQTRGQVMGTPEARSLLAYSEISDSIAFLCWLHRDAIIAKLEKEIDAGMDPNSKPLSHEDRERHHAEIAADLLDIERQECAAIWLAMSQGLPCEFRADCHPMAVLQIRLVVKGNGHLPPTTEGVHAYSIVGGR